MLMWICFLRMVTNKRTSSTKASNTMDKLKPVVVTRESRAEVKARLPIIDATIIEVFNTWFLMSSRLYLSGAFIINTENMGLIMILW